MSKKIHIEYIDSIKTVIVLTDKKAKKQVKS